MPELATIPRVTALLLVVIAVIALTGCPMAPPPNMAANNANATSNADEDGSDANNAIALIPGNIERVPPQTQPVSLAQDDEAAVRAAIARITAAVRDGDGTAFYSSLAGAARLHINATLIRVSDVVDDAVRRERLSEALESARATFTPYDPEAALNVLANVTRDGVRHVWVRVDGAGDGALHFVAEDGQWRFLPRLPAGR